MERPRTRRAEFNWVSLLPGASEGGSEKPVPLAVRSGKGWGLAGDAVIIGAFCGGDLGIAQGGDGGAVLALEREDVVVLLLLVEGLGMGGKILANAFAADRAGDALGVAATTVLELSDLKSAVACHATTVAKNISNRNINRLFATEKSGT